MPKFFHKTKPITVRAYRLEDCPKPITDWLTEPPTKPDQKTKTTKGDNK